MVVFYELNPGIQNFMQDIELAKLTECLCYKGQDSKNPPLYCIQKDRGRKQVSITGVVWCSPCWHQVWPSVTHWESALAQLLGCSGIQLLRIEGL